MTPSLPRPARLGVPSRGHRWAALLLLALLAAPPALAQEGKKPAGEKQKDKQKEKEKPEEKPEEKRKEKPRPASKSKEGTGKGEVVERKKTAEETLLESLGESWRKGDVRALAARFPSKRRISLRLPGSEAGDYRAEQAKALLEDYFKGRTITKVGLKSVKETAGTFSIEVRRTSDGKTLRASLLLVVGTEEEKGVLVGAREGP